MNAYLETNIYHVNYSNEGQLTEITLTNNKNQSKPQWHISCKPTSTYNKNKYKHHPNRIIEHIVRTERSRNIFGEINIISPNTNNRYHIGRIYTQRTSDGFSTHLHISEHHRPDLIYNITDIWNMDATNAYHWLSQHIPIDQIIQHLHAYNNETKNPTICIHYYPNTNIPCGATSINNPINNIPQKQWDNTHIEEYILQPSQDPQKEQLILHTIYYPKKSKERQIAPTLIISIGAESDTNNINAIDQCLRKNFDTHPDILALSQHEKIRLYRHIHDDQQTMAKQLLNRAMQHYHHRMNPPTLTLPITTLNINPAR